MMFYAGLYLYFTRLGGIIRNMLTILGDYIMPITSHDQILTTKEAAPVVGCAAPSLKQSRVSGELFGVQAPAFIRMGRTIRYKYSTLINWREQFGETTTLIPHSTNGR